MKSIFDMSFEELIEYEKKQRQRLNLCEECLGSGKINEGGMFSNTYKCEKCKGTGKNKNER